MNRTHESKSSQTNSKIFLGCTLTTIADMLMGRAITLPDGKVREPRRRAYDQAYIEKNREELYRKKRERYAANKDAINAKRRAEYAAADADKKLEKNISSAEWAEENPEKMRRFRRAYYRRQRKAALARTAEYVKAWRAAEDRGAYLEALRAGDIDQRRAAKWAIRGKR